MTIKVDDIFDFALRVRAFLPDEDVETNTILSKNQASVPIIFPKRYRNENIINISDYKYEYRLAYSNGKEMGGQCCVLNKKLTKAYKCDIEECIKKEMTRSCEEVTDYEIFDVDKSDLDFQTAKVRVKSIK